MIHEQQLLAEQKHYYGARAAEYDAWWERRGRYDRGAAANKRWFAEAASLERELQRFEPRGDVLELACGTGLWTRVLARHASHVTAVDAAPEMLELNRQRLRRPALRSRHAPVDYVQADLFSWRPPAGRFDVCFFGFWLSHVPESRFAGFWETVASALRPGGRVFFVDSDRSDRSTAADHHFPQAGDQIMQRRLDDGREFRIIKRFYEPEALEHRLSGLRFRVEVHRTGEFFLYGAGEAARSR